MTDKNLEHEAREWLAKQPMNPSMTTEDDVRMYAAFAAQVLEAANRELKKENTTLAAEVRRLRGEVEEYKDGLREIMNWARAYPVETFPEPTKEDWERAHGVMKEGGLVMTAFNASCMRHVVTEVAKIAQSALDAPQPTESQTTGLREGEEVE